MHEKGTKNVNENVIKGAKAISKANKLIMSADHQEPLDE